ncbi:hypothetical protein [Streptomyces prasinus]|uniref:hypothetical protein n=1 Tax=Streptomyces prasinus TaxID=67345 RepID=UPI0006EBDF57|nr:hypothetical protein [Streptomyces prasinus]
MDSLRSYLSEYAAGRHSREEMIATVAAWPLQERDLDPAHTLPDHQDNTTDVLAAAVLNGQLTEEDYREILRQRAN